MPTISQYECYLGWMKLPLNFRIIRTFRPLGKILIDHNNRVHIREQKSRHSTRWADAETISIDFHNQIKKSQYERREREREHISLWLMDTKCWMRVILLFFLSYLPFSIHFIFHLDIFFLRSRFLVLLLQFFFSSSFELFLCFHYASKLCKHIDCG